MARIIRTCATCYSTTPGLSRAYNTGIRETHRRDHRLHRRRLRRPAGLDRSSIARGVRRRPGRGHVVRPGACARRRSPTVGVTCRRCPFQQAARFSHTRWISYLRHGRRTSRPAGASSSGSAASTRSSAAAVRSSPRRTTTSSTASIALARSCLLCPTVKVDHYGVRNYTDQWPATLRAYGIGDGAFYFKHVRCGDWLRARTAHPALTRMSVREVLSQLGVRRRPSRADYVRSCFIGIWQSLRFRIDRRSANVPARAHA